MITIEKTIDLPELYPLNRLGNKEELLFFDIETTGFSGDLSKLYLIGCVYFQGGAWRLIQWFSDTPESEGEILDSFFTFLRRYRVMIHFNGDQFDIPFLLKRCAAHGLPWNFERVGSIDIYKRIRPVKKLLGLENMKQKSIEAFLGISREDMYGGGQLIEVYKEYLHTREEFLLRLLLLHNEDDLKGMPQILPILYYHDFFVSAFTLLDEQVDQNGSTIRLTLECGPDTLLPVPIKAATPAYRIAAEKNKVFLSVKIHEGTLKHFYPNYKDYYYLIYEDAAVHKSVGEYVDREARIKATRETCYTKKAGRFLPQPAALWTPEFKSSSRERESFFEYRPGCFSDAARLNSYLREILRLISSGK